MSHPKALDHLGPHLLGRIPSPHDDRTLRVAPFLGTDADLVRLAEGYLKKTTYGYRHWEPSPPPAGSNWAYALAALAKIAPPAPVPAGTDVIWKNIRTILDQGQTGTCVGNGCVQWGNADPVEDNYLEADAKKVYIEATILDGAADYTYQQGATVLSGVKAMTKRGRIGVYAAAASIAEAQAYVRAHGPVIMGTDWTNDMFLPSGAGFVRPTGGVAGGHCYVLVGDLPTEGALLFMNSWGPDWGIGGYFKMKVADAVALFASQGEAWCALELAL